MGFGSYDESEQQRRETNKNDDDSEGVNIHEKDHTGEVHFETGASTSDLMDQLKSIKSKSAEED